jgi:hypothetical protein
MKAIPFGLLLVNLFICESNLTKEVEWSWGEKVCCLGLAVED